MALTKEDVAECYRVFLKRNPESEQVIEEKLSACADIWSLCQLMLDCKEFRLRVSPQDYRRLPSQDPDCSVEMSGSPDDLERLRSHVRETWTRLGLVEPHNSVLTGPEFVPQNMNPDVEAQFYASGAGSVDELLVVLRRNDLSFPKGLVIDFGCGLARVGEHLSLRAENYLGVDISPSHLNAARSRLAGLGRTNVEFELLPDFLKSARKADLIYCVLVLQHNPPPVMLEMLDHMMYILNKSGLLFVQISTTIYDYEFDLRKYMEGINEQKYMEMHALPQRYIYESIERNGCQLIEIYRDDCTGPVGDSYRFLIRKKTS